MLSRARRPSCSTCEQFIPCFSAISAIHAGSDTFFLTALVSVRARYAIVSTHIRDSSAPGACCAHRQTGGLYAAAFCFLFSLSMIT